MNALISTTTAAKPLGAGTSQVLFEVPGGPYAGRQVVLFQDTDNSLAYAAAIPPYRTWTSPISIATDVAASSFDAVMAPNSDIFVTYSELSTLRLIMRKLTFSAGAWSVGSAVAVNATLQSYDPSIQIDKNGTLWIAYYRFSAPNRSLYVKSSTDGGATWGSGSSDPGTALAVSGLFASVRLIVSPSTLYAVYAVGANYVGLRAMPLATGSWGSELVVVSSASVQTVLATAVKPDGSVGIVYVSAGIFYRRYDGVQLEAPVAIDTATPAQVQLFYRGAIPLIVWTVSRGTNQAELMVSHASSGFFSAPAALDQRATTAKSVLLYDLSAASFVDRTTAAATGGSGDVTHPSSGATVRDSGDVIFVGMDQPFRALQFSLSTAGVGGTVGYRYWDGTLWRGFTPAAGIIDLTSSSSHVTLWADNGQVPGDWQRSVVNGQARFWVRIDVISTYATAPVANQLTTLSDLVAVSGRG